MTKPNRYALHRRGLCGYVLTDSAGIVLAFDRYLKDLLTQWSGGEKLAPEIKLGYLRVGRIDWDVYKALKSGELQVEDVPAIEITEAIPGYLLNGEVITRPDVIKQRLRRKARARNQDKGNEQINLFE